MKPYLAGPIQHSDGHGVDWREQIQEDFPNIDWRDPLSKYDPTDPKVDFYDEDGDGDLYKLQTEIAGDDETYVTPEDIVEGDKRVIDDADSLLVGWSEVPTAGTPMEMMYVYMLNELHPHRDHRPIVVWWRDKDEAEGRLSPWVQYHADYVTGDRDEAVTFLRVRRRGTEDNPWSEKEIQVFMDEIGASGD